MQKRTLTDIIDMIKPINGVSDYKITNVAKQSYELFFVHGKIETVRKAVDDTSYITLYVDHDLKKGSSSFEVTAAMDDRQLADKLLDAVDCARLVFDEPYDIPSDATSKGTLPSNIECLDEKQAAAKIAAAVDRANRVDGCDINALEIFVVKTVTRVVNSRGVDREQTKYTISVEAIPTANSDEQSVELFQTYTFADLDEDALTDELSKRLGDARARLTAIKPTFKIDCPVIFNAYELNELFSELITNANYSTVYAHANTLEVGDALQSAPKYDKLNITMRGRINGCPSSALFDENDGAELVDKTIVKDGVLSGLYGSHRIAQYLRQSPTGNLGCIDVGTGSLSDSEMTRSPHLELVYLSGLQVDLYSDYIGGEIRLAYYFDGQKRVPVTSIAMSAKLSDALNTVRLSDVKTCLGAYCGPKRISIEGVKIF